MIDTVPCVADQPAKKRKRDGGGGGAADERGGKAAASAGVPAGGVAEQRSRLIARHLETWTDAKTEQWGAATAEEGAAKRTDANDVINARLIECCRPFADLVIDSV